jgi:SH3-like domain-containing protein
MRHVHRALIVTIFAAVAAAAHAQPQVQGPATGTYSGLPVPRFVSLKADRVNMHIGPAKTYEVKWLYQRAGLPVEVTAEFETWRRIRDAEGTEGWVYHSLLSGRRTATVIAKTQDGLVPIYEKPDVESAVTAKLERGVIGNIRRCSGNGWCYMQARGFQGYVQQNRLWGVYPNEKID